MFQAFCCVVVLFRFKYTLIPSAFCQALPFTMFVQVGCCRSSKAVFEDIEFGLELAAGKLTLNMFVYIYIILLLLALLLLSLSSLLLELLLWLIMYMYKYLLQFNNNIYIYIQCKTNHTSHGGINLSTFFFVGGIPPTPANADVFLLVKTHNETNLFCLPCIKWRNKNQS